jgi:hypothetical protein
MQYVNRLIIMCLLIWSVPEANAQDLASLKSEKPFQLSGSASIFGNYFNTSDSLVTMSPYAYGISIAPVIKSYGFSMPFTFAYANRKSNFTYPFFRVGAAPSYKWVKLFLGNNTINFNRYAFSGLNCFGVGIEINPKSFYLAYFTGQMSKAHFVDSTATEFNRITPRYAVKGFAIKAGLKSKTQRLLFTYFSGTDDEKSLTYFNPKYGLKPRYNKALGGEMHLKFGKYITLKSNAGLSIFTRNKNAANIDTLLRASGDAEIPSWAKSIEKNPNTSTQLLYAYDHSLQFNSNTFGLGLSYKWLQPDFKTLGFRFEANNIKQITIEPSFRLWKNKVSTNFSIGLQSNANTDKLALSTNNKIYSAMLNIVPNEKFYLNASVSNFGVNVRSNPNYIEDSISVRNINNNINVNSAYYISNNGGQSKSIGFNYNLQKSTETYEFNIFNKTEFNSLFANVFFNNQNTKSMSYTLGLNYTNSTNIFYQLPDKLFNIQSYGLSCNLSKSFLKDERLNTFIGGNFNNSGVVDEEKKLAYGLIAGLNFKMAKSLTLGYNYNYNSSPIAGRKLQQRNISLNLSNSF